MKSALLTGRSTVRIVTAFGLLAGMALYAASPVLAGECPADQVMAGAVAPVTHDAKGVTDEVLAVIDLSSKGGDFEGHMFRMRKLVVQPGGIVPWHSHETRPANILITEGSITEYRSSCKVPIEHKAGEVAVESGDLAHWWKNNAKVPAVLYSADILPPAMHDDHTM